MQKWDYECHWGIYTYCLTRRNQDGSSTRTQSQPHQLQRNIFSSKQVLLMNYLIGVKEIFQENIPFRSCWRVADFENTIYGSRHGITFKLEPIDKTTTWKLFNNETVLWILVISNKKLKNSPKIKFLIECLIY